jgi:RimJ/RimL family protein N-acetyltransferase
MIVGKKIVLRAIEEKDLEYLQKWQNDPVISELVVGWSFPVSMADQSQWFQNSIKKQHTQRFIVECKEKGIIGLTGLWDIDWQNRHALTALKIGEKTDRGRGIGADAIMTITSYAFYEVGLNRLYGSILPYNHASYKAYVQKCGWKVEGCYRQHVYRKGKFYDLLYVATLKEDYERLPSAADYMPAVTRGERESFVEIDGSEKADF